MDGWMDELMGKRMNQQVGGWIFTTSRTIPMRKQEQERRKKEAAGLSGHHRLLSQYDLTETTFTRCNPVHNEVSSYPFPHSSIYLVLNPLALSHHYSIFSLLRYHQPLPASFQIIYLLKIQLNPRDFEKRPPFNTTPGGVSEKGWGEGGVSS